ncbi:unnamed protein product [Cyprideis torosa]|uniref:Uncharacterized protein n=1 Tax=Cyprideis torosa TaxID=163714 RepID=A0A7R8ZM25_9CRUS|nr:unnamed protein product [Cyprideis torosa]CAG0884910.1 unnamed protein product [Cyprideis torosa]
MPKLQGPRLHHRERERTERRTCSAGNLVRRAHLPFCQGAQLLLSPPSANTTPFSVIKNMKVFTLVLVIAGICANGASQKTQKELIQEADKLLSDFKFLQNALRHKWQEVSTARISNNLGKPIGTVFRFKKNNDDYVYRGQITVEAPAKVVFDTIWSKHENFKNWNNELVESRVVARLNDNTMITYSATADKGPIKSRDFVNLCRADVDALKQKYYKAYKSIRYDQVPPVENRIRAFNYVSGFTVVGDPSNPSRSQVNIITHADIKLTLVPAQRLNDNTMITYSATADKGPIKSRDFVNLCRADVDAQKQKYYKAYKSIRYDQVPPVENRIRAFNYVSGFTVVGDPSNPSRSQVNIITHADIKLTLVPAQVVHAIQPKSIRDLIIALAAEAEKNYSADQNLQSGSQTNPTQRTGPQGPNNRNSANTNPFIFSVPILRSSITPQLVGGGS